MMECKIVTVAIPVRRHRKPERHWQEPSIGRMVAEFLLLVLGFYAALAIPEIVCAALGV